MKRIRDSGVPPSTPNHNANHHLVGGHSGDDEQRDVNRGDVNQRQQADSAGNPPPPRMHTPAGNPTAANNPLAPPPDNFGENEPLPDWDQLMQMMDHSPPVLNQQQPQASAKTSDGEDKVSDADQSVDDLPEDDRSVESASSDTTFEAESELDYFERKIKPKILAAIKAGEHTLLINPNHPNEFRALLDICRQHPSVTNLEIHIRHDKLARELPELDQALTDFFLTHHQIQTLKLSSWTWYVVPWSAQLLLALFSNPSLQTIQLNLKSFATPNPQENKAIAEAITKNTSVQELQIFLHADAKKNEFIIDAISENKNLTTLDILGKLPAGIGPILANMLRLNSNIKCLKFMVDWQDDLAELPAAMAAMSENNSVEALQFEQPYDFIEFRKEIIDPLLTNKNLKTLQVPHRGTFNPEVMATLTQLIGKHPNLSAIGPLHIPDKPHTFKAFIEDLKSNPNPQIQSISISWEEVLWIEGFDVKMPIYARYILDVFDALKAFPNLNHLSLHHLPDFDCLLEFLKHRPSISCIELPDDTLSSEQSQEKLLALVTSYSHITQFKFHDGYNKIKSGNEKKFQRDLQQALALNAEVRSEAAIENTSAAMNVLLLAHSQRNPELPVMNLDVIRQLVAAMVSYLPAEKVKAIFDDLVLYAPKNHASQIM
ncbi:MAG: hypothetical protein RL369_304 [Pseudomonadota bacterium]